MGNPRWFGWSAIVLLSLFASSGMAQESGTSKADSGAVGTPGLDPSRIESDGSGLGAVPSLAVDGAADTRAAAKRGPSITSQEFWMEFFSNPISYLLLVMLALYLFIILPAQRSNRKAQREQREMLANLKKNDRVVTSFGVHGVISNIQNESGTVTLRIDESTNAKLTVNRETIRVVKKD